MSSSLTIALTPYHVRSKTRLGLQNCLYTVGVKILRAACLLSLIGTILIASGCGSGEMNSDANAEKKKEETAIDKRADAIGKVTDQATAPASSSQ